MFFCLGSHDHLYCMMFDLGLLVSFLAMVSGDGMGNGSGNRMTINYVQYETSQMQSDKARLTIY